jgi:hypothetical protein
MQFNTKKTKNQCSARALSLSLIFLASNNLFAADTKTPLGREFTAEELLLRHEAFKKVNHAFGLADSQLPPCAGLDHASEVALRYEPARECKLSQEFFSETLQHDRSLRDGCIELSRYMEDILNNPALCYQRSIPGWDRAKRAEIEKIKLRATKKMENLPGIAESKLHEMLRDYPDGGGAGEMGIMSCYLPVALGLQFRKKQLTLFNQIYGMANFALSENCNSPDNSDASFLRFLREGGK